MQFNDLLDKVGRTDTPDFKVTYDQKPNGTVYVHIDGEFVGTIQDIRHYQFYAHVDGKVRHQPGAFTSRTEEEVQRKIETFLKWGHE